MRPERKAAELANREKVDIRLHTIIYNVVDEIKRAMQGVLEPVFKETYLGTAEVRDTFRIPKVGMIAGLFFGVAFGIAGIGAAVLGQIADHTGIIPVFQGCAFLPLIGLLTVFLPEVRSRK